MDLNMKPYAEYVFTFLDTYFEYVTYIKAANCVLISESPYHCGPFEQSPLIAWIMTPTILIKYCAGKFIFSIFDTMIAIVLFYIVEHKLRMDGVIDAKKIAKYTALSWYCNFLSVIHAMRGAANSVSCFFILLSLYWLQLSVQKTRNGVLSGGSMGVAIHLRCYSLLFGMPMCISLGNYKICSSPGESIRSLIPNKEQITFTTSAILSFSLLSSFMYLLYGYEYITNTFVHELFGNTSAPISVLLYESFSTILNHTNIVNCFKVLEIAIFMFSILYWACKGHRLYYALFLQPVMLLFYGNKKSQYMLWYIALLPLIFQHVRNDYKKLIALILCCMYFCSDILVDVLYSFDNDATVKTFLLGFILYLMWAFEVFAGFLLLCIFYRCGIVIWNCITNTEDIYTI